ncbi:imidazolonepropionase-like amidohydrolase [Granulicella aggregans]|uniref:Imidazolonepropionase-like amidohydrolase n=1 Tax=Granulicella aggregans TaxID=474949 RepID=A0A7W8E6X9_9BACT|nr:amidohydrolase family protein [Granulicella aggregans]MBB5061126.1 imidazolonepropionase-like amidohydrolase [Granulicella aggregans]
MPQRESFVSNAMQTGTFLLIAMEMVAAAIGQGARNHSSPADALRPLIRTNAPVIALSHVTLFDGSGSPARHDQTIIVDHGRITAVGPSNAVTIPSEAQLLNERGKTVLPGLVGMHEHMFYISAGGGPGHLILGTEQAESAPRLYLAAGITTARTTGSIEPAADLAIKAAIDNGMQIGPDLDVTGPYFDGPGTFLIQNQRMNGISDVRETVDYWSKRDITSFKAYMFIQPADLQATIEQAHAHGLKVTGHLCSVGFTEAINMGIDNLEHGLIVDSEFDPQKKPGVCPAKNSEGVQTLLQLDVHGQQIQRLIKSMISHHVALTSTLATYENSDTDEPPAATLRQTRATLSALSWADFLRLKALLGKPHHMGETDVVLALLHKEMAFEREFVRQGGLLIAGCDPTGFGGVVAGLGDQREMELLVQAGFPTAEAVAIFSSHGARYLGRENEIGTVEPGKQADLLLLDGDFEHDVSAIRKPEIVFKKGVGWDSAKLQASVAGIAGQR